MRPALCLCLTAALLALGASASAGEKPGPSAEKVLKAKLLPIAAKDAKSSHGPFEAGECAVCHQSNDPAHPGPLLKEGDELCFDCHDEFGKGKGRKLKHPKVQHGCTGCHNPHNSGKRALLVQ
jgi:predicted CXXCH cytochrome family protein